MSDVVVLGATWAGLAAAARLARVGHRVRVSTTDPDWAATLRSTLAPTLDFPAPWRDLFKKSGRPAAGALGLYGVELVADRTPPTDRGERWYADKDAYGEPIADAWRSFVDAADDTWQALRPLGAESPLDPSAASDEALKRTGLHPRRTLADVAATLPHPDLRERVTRLATDHGLDPGAQPAWLTSRLAIERTFGRWRLVASDGSPRAASILVDVVADRLADRGVIVDADAPTTASATRAVIDTRDPQIVWHRPRLWRPSETFFDQLRRRPPISDPAVPGVFAASASSAAGPEPWAQLLSGALAAYAAHAFLTGEDIRPTNKALSR